MRYAKRDRMRFASHRDIARAVERALRRARVPVASSRGFTPHPKVSYAGAAPTGAASEAEYLELTLTEPQPAEQTRADLDAALPDGLDVIEVALVGSGDVGSLTDRLEASRWRIELPGVAPRAVERAVAAFRAADTVELERTTKKGRRTVDARKAVVELDVAQPPSDAAAHPAVVHALIRNAAPTLRPDDLVTVLDRLHPIAPPSPPRATRLAQGSLAELESDPAAPAGAGDDHRRAATAEGGDGA